MQNLFDAVTAVLVMATALLIGNVLTLLALKWLRDRGVSLPLIQQSITFTYRTDAIQTPSGSEIKRPMPFWRKAEAMRANHDELAKAADKAIKRAGEELRKRLPWNPKYPDGCTSCGTKDRRHHAKGMDLRCYQRAFPRRRRAKSSSKRRA